MLQVHGNANIIVVMSDKQQPKNAFVREQIKDKPKNYKRMWVRLGESAACGGVFALAVCLVLLFMIPVLRQEEGSVPDTGAQDSQQASVEETEQGSEEKEETQTPEERQPMTLDDYQQIQTELYAIGNTANKSIVTITGVVSDTDWFNNSYEREGQGCGTIIGESGGKLWILTEKKTIKDAAKIKVTFVNDAVAEAKLVRYDGNTGLAALTVDLEDLETSTQNAITVMKTAGSNTIHKGSIVIALGSPLGTNYSILTGTITATNNEISTPDNNYSVYTTDIVASENGSGVLINMDGELVGVVMQSYSAASANTLTAVEISELMPVIDLLFADKEVPYFGVHISTVTQHIAQKYDIPKGVYIKKVEMDSPAMDAGLQSGDVIRSVAGQEVASAEQFREVLLQLTPKENYSVTVMREGTKGYKKITCKLKAGVLQ